MHKDRGGETQGANTRIPLDKSHIPRGNLIIRDHMCKNLFLAMWEVDKHPRRKQ